MIGNGKLNGKAHNIVNRLAELDSQWYAKRQSREAESSYAAGETSRMNPVPRGIDPLGSDADYHYRTERNYFLMVERGRAAVRNHPLVEQGINRLIANLRLGEFSLDVNSGDEAVDAAVKDKWKGWIEDKQACDFEQERTFPQQARQSFFSQVQDGDILHIPTVEGSLQTWESHHLRTPWGHRPTGDSGNGIVHGVEVAGGVRAAYWITPRTLGYHQSLMRRGQSRRFDAQDEAGNPIVFWLGFTHRFRQRRGISRLSPPRDAMNGFDDLNYANIKSSLRRTLISYLMESNQPQAPQPPLSGGKLPKAGDRYAADLGLGLESIIVEQLGEPAQVFQTPAGYQMKGWNANLPSEAFFEHSALLLTMLAVNLDLPLMFLLLDGSLVNFHGGRMTFDQAKMRFQQLQRDQIDGLWNPTYEWKVRQWITPGSMHYDGALARAVARGANPFRFKFRPKGWPYVKPLEDAAGEDLAERRNLKSLRAILANRGIDHDEHVPEVIHDRGQWARAAIKEAIAIRNEFPEADINVSEFFRELWYGNEATGVQLALNASDGDEPPPSRSLGAARGS